MGFIAVIKALDCRRKASEFLRAAQLSSDPDESLGWLQLSDAWLTLAEQLDQRASSKKNYSAAAARQPEGLTEKRTIANVGIGDVLRRHLALKDEDAPRGAIAQKAGDALRQRLALKIEDPPRGRAALDAGEVLRERLALTNLTGDARAGTAR